MTGRTFQAGVSEGQSTTRPPFFDGTKYAYWKERMRIFIQSNDFDSWMVIKHGNTTPANIVDGIRVPKLESEYDDQDKKNIMQNAKAINYLYCAVNPDDYRKISRCKSANEMWTKLEVTYEGTSQVKDAKVDILLHEYELFSMKENESIDSYFERFSTIINNLDTQGKYYTDHELVRKILRYKRRKSIALKATKEVVEENEEDDDESLNSEDNPELALVIKRFNKFIKKSFKPRRDNGKKATPPKCYECGEIGHIKPYCPKLKQGKDKKFKKKQKAYISWENDHSSSETSDEDEEIPNLCLMATEEEVSSNSFSTPLSSSSDCFSLDDLHSAFSDLYGSLEKMNLEEGESSKTKSEKQEDVGEKVEDKKDEHIANELPPEWRTSRYHPLDNVIGEISKGAEISTAKVSTNFRYTFDERLCWEEMGFQPQLNDSGRPMVSGMQPPQRLLQYISSYILRGRVGNHPQMSKDDSMLIYAILKPVKVNWGKYIMSYMDHCRASARALPYPILLTFLLKKKGFVFANEDMTPETPFWRIKRETVMRAMHDTNDENHASSGPSERQFALSSVKVNGLYNGAPSIIFSAAEEEVLAGKFSRTLIGRSKERISLSALEDFLIRGGFKEFKLRRPGNFEVLFIFIQEDNYQRWFYRRRWNIQGILITICKWSPNHSPNHDNPIFPVWVEVSHVPVHLNDHRALFTIASSFGRPIKLDAKTVIGATPERGYYGPPSFYQSPNHPPFQTHPPYHPHQNPYDDDYQVNNGSDYYPYHEEPPYDTPSRNFRYSPYQDFDGDDYYEPHGDHNDYDQNGPMYEDRPDPLVEEIIRLEQKIFHFDEVLFAEGSWYEPPYSRDYTLFAEEQIEANKVAIRERAKLLESVRKEKEFERRLCEGSTLMQKMLDDFQRERLEVEAKADKLVNDLCKAVELKRSLQSQDQMREINVQKEALEPKTNPEPINQQVPVLEDSPSPKQSQKPESITTLSRATVVMLPKSLPSQVPANIVVHEVEPTEGPDSEPSMVIQEEEKEEEVLPMAINDHLLNCVEDTPVLEEIEPTTFSQDSNAQEFEEESIDEEILCTDEPIPSIETCANNASSADSDQTLFDSLPDKCNLIFPENSWSQRSWDELLVSGIKDSSMGEITVIIIEPQIDSQPIEYKEEINLPKKANDVDQLRRHPPPPTYLESPPFIMLPPSYRNESRILDLDRGKIQTGWHQKRVRRAKLYDSRIGKSRKKWIPHRPSYPTVDRNEVQLIDAASRTRFDEWGHSRVLHESMTHTLITADTTFAFTLAGRSFQLTVREMVVRLGLYTQEETEQPEFYDDPFCLPADFDAVAFWREHSSDDKEFINKKSKARYWIWPSWRILSFVLSTSFFGRPSNTDRVYKEDMFVFWSLHDRESVNVAVYLARFLYSQSYGCKICTNITLIPEVEGAREIGDYRPIALSTFFSKMLSMIVANRLGPMLNKIISPEHAGFQKGKGIEEHILLTNELMHKLDSKVRGGNVMIKLDMAKAFDKISWNYLQAILQAFGFNEQSISLLLQNLRATYMSVLVNGKPNGFFKIKRGVKQGDPLSPLLFIIGSEGFARSLNHAINSGYISPYKVGKNRVVSHLAFVDDLIIFLKGDLGNILRFRHLLDSYLKASGQEVNKKKSRIFCKKGSRCLYTSKMKDTLGFKVGNPPFKYLGSTITQGKLKKDSL
ncbi:unnamed protein product [Cuscuta campestris]|uniref:Reverse transcriptase domain-containing protein n=1 Tax=Cuscuta campestris TaxID=132261 RepID=A0A484LBQ9_9ASTE|nr:unnamed protein product [Cuscuta campestris]